ncbi:hypothetical protein [Methanolacinia petrolearia]
MIRPYKLRSINNGISEQKTLPGHLKEDNIGSRCINDRITFPPSA